MISPEEQREIEAFTKQTGGALAELIQERFGTHLHFVLVCGTDKDSSGGRGGWMTYVASHKTREAMIQLLREMASKVEADPRSRSRAYLSPAPVPQRFDLRRLENVPTRGSKLDVPQPEGTRPVLLHVNSRLGGVLMLSPDEEQALQARIYRADGPRKSPPQGGKARRREARR